MEVPFKRANRGRREIETFHSRRWNAHPLVLAVKKEDVEFLLLEMQKYRNELDKIQVEGKEFWKMVVETRDANVVKEYLRRCNNPKEAALKMGRYLEKLKERLPFLNFSPLEDKLNPYVEGRE